MRLAFFIEQNLCRLDAALENPEFVCVMDRAGRLRDQLRRLPDRHRRASDNFVKLTAFDELHAEIAGPVALAHFVNWNDARLFETGGSFSLPAKALHVRFAGPLTKANDF